MSYSKKELAEITADRKYWESYGKRVGARLHGWTCRISAYFIMPDNTGFNMDKNICALVDATSKTKAEEKLIAAAIRFQKDINNSGDGVCRAAKVVIKERENNGKK